YSPTADNQLETAEKLRTEKKRFTTIRGRLRGQLRSRSWISLDAEHLPGEGGVLRTLTRVRDV
ncbi:MAG: hypothetical protein KAU10_04155, partial [Dehalococcoidia bacterium]|nr:hypothetical protein [Dehalococcoidia bacterium]